MRYLVDAGLSARDVIDANQVVSCSDYVNSLAEALGAELEKHWRASRDGHATP